MSGQLQVKIVNLTPHYIVIYDVYGKPMTVSPSGRVASILETPKSGVIEDGIQIDVVELGQPELPPPENGTIYIVPSIVAMQTVGRTDVVTPDTGPSSVIRNKDGRIVGIAKLRRFYKA